MERRNQLSRSSGSGLPTPSPSTSASGGAGNRRTRAGGSSEDSQTVPQTGLSSTQGRVGSPPVRPLPLEAGHVQVSTGGAILEGSQIKSILTKATQILDENGIAKSPHNTLSRQPRRGSFDGAWALDEEDEEVWDGRADIVFRNRPWELPNAADHTTLLMEAAWSDQDSPPRWERAVKQTKALVDNMFLSGHIPSQIGVEMISTDLTRPTELSGVHGQPDLRANWPTILDRIYTALEQNPSSHGATRKIGLFDIRFRGSGDPWTTTVRVALSEDCEERLWSLISRLVLDCLRPTRSASTVAVKIEHFSDQMDGCFGFDYPPHDEVNARFKIDDYKSYPSLKPRESYDIFQRANAGAAIGAAVNIRTEDGQSQKSPSIGTLGCYLEVRKTPQAAPELVALTNYHVLRTALDGVQSGFGKTGSPKILPPNPGSDAYHVDHNGGNPSFFERRGKFVESPPRRMHALHVHSLEERVKNNPQAQQIQRARSLLAEKTAWFDRENHILGPIVAASGFARRRQIPGHPRKTCRMDWALFQVKDQRAGRNILPAEGEFKSSHEELDTSHYYPEVEQRMHRQGGPALGSLAHNSTVYKVGAATGATAGEYNDLVELRCYAEDRHVNSRPSYERTVHGITVGGTGYAFGVRGDSGSVVCSDNGRVLGLLFRGKPPKDKSDAGYAYVTPIEDVLQDIKEVTGWHDCQIA